MNYQAKSIWSLLMNSGGDEEAGRYGSSGDGVIARMADAAFWALSLDKEADATTGPAVLYGSAGRAGDDTDQMILYTKDRVLFGVDGVVSVIARSLLSSLQIVQAPPIIATGNWRPLRIKLAYQDGISFVLPLAAAAKPHNSKSLGRLLPSLIDDLA